MTISQHLCHYLATHVCRDPSAGMAARVDSNLNCIIRSSRLPSHVVLGFVNRVPDRALGAG